MFGNGRRVLGASARMALVFVFTASAVMLASASIGAAQGDSVVSIPDSGDPLVNGQALVDAIAAATASGEPTTINVAAGRFDLQGTPLVFTDGIALVGQGETTELCLCRSSRGGGFLVFEGDAKVTDVEVGTYTYTYDHYGDGEYVEQRSTYGSTPVIVRSGEAEVARLTTSRSAPNSAFASVASGASLSMIDTSASAGPDDEYTPGATLIRLAEGAEMSLTGSSIGSTDSYYGGGGNAIYAKAGSKLTLKDSTVRGTGPAINTLGDVMIVDSVVRGTECGYYCSESQAIRMTGGTLTAVGSEILGAERVVVTTDSTVRMRDSVVRGGDTWGGDGPSVSMTGGSLALVGTSIDAGELAISLSGTGAYMSGGSVDSGSISTDGEFLLDRVALGPNVTVNGSVGCRATLVDEVPGAPAGCIDQPGDRFAFGVDGSAGPAVGGWGHLVPAIVEAEDYDLASVDGAATFSDSNEANVGNSQYRLDAVDIYRTREAAGGGYVSGSRVVGAIRGGEFTEYSIDVPTDGTYDFSLRLASGSDDPGGVEVLIDGVLLGRVDIAPGDLGGWWSFSDVAVGQTQLSRGPHVVRVAWLDNGQVNFDRMSIDQIAAGGAPFECSVDGGVVSWPDFRQRTYVVYRSLDEGNAYHRLGETASESPGATTFSDPNPFIGGRYQVQYEGIDRVDCTVTAEPTNPATSWVSEDTLADRPVHSVATTPDGNTIVISDSSEDGFGARGNVYRRIAAGWEAPSYINLPVGSEVLSVAIDDAGDSVVLGRPTVAPGSVTVADRGLYQWFDLGGVNGPERQIAFGRATAISADGNTIAVSSDNGRVRVFSRDDRWGSAWEPRGVDGVGGGRTVAMSADGNSVAIGNFGRVRVFEWTGAAWAGRGAILRADEGDVAFGRSVAMSRDGDTIVVGTGDPKYDADDGNLKVFTWSGSDWVQRGQSLAILAGGGRVAVSGDGSSFAVSKATDAGSVVQVYGWLGDRWVSRGQPVPGSAPAMNNDGTLVVTNVPEVFSFTGRGDTPEPPVDPEPTVVAVPGVIEAEDYDVDGFFDTDSGNAGEVYRTDDVDVYPSVEDDVIVPDRFHVGRTRDGEWLEYTVNVDAVGTYDIVLRYSSGHDGSGRPDRPDEPGSVVLSVDGGEVGRFDVDNTGGFSVFTEATVATADLTVGEHVIRVDIVDGYFDLDRFVVTEAEVDPEPEPPLGGFECFVDVSTLSWPDHGAERYWAYRSVDGGESYQWLGRTLGETTLRDPAPVVGALYQVHYAGIPRQECTPVEPVEPAQRLAFGVGGVAGLSDGAHAVPGVIEAENYDAPANGALPPFEDFNADNVGTSDYRSDAVDLYLTRTAQGAGYVDGGVTVGAIRGREWVEYSIDVATAATYDFSLSLASGGADPGGFVVSVDGVDLPAVDIAPGQLGGWWSFTDVAAGSADLAAGRHIVRITFTGNGQLNFDNFTIN